MMLWRRMDRMAVVVRNVVGLGLGLCLGVSPPPPPLAAGLRALRPLRPRTPMAIDGTRFLVARVHLEVQSCEQLISRVYIEH